MKKKNLIGKKILSLGLASSLLATPMCCSITCFAEGSTWVEKVKTTIATPYNYIKRKFTRSHSATEQPKVSNASPKSSMLAKGTNQSDAESYLTKTWDISKWVLLSAFLAYSGYKNFESLEEFTKEFFNFFAENKNLFKDIVNNGVSIVKGIGYTAKSTFDLISETFKFIGNHPDAAKTALAGYGGWQLYNKLKAKAVSFFKSKKIEGKHAATNVNNFYFR